MERSLRQSPEEPNPMRFAPVRWRRQRGDVEFPVGVEVEADALATADFVEVFESA